MREVFWKIVYYDVDEEEQNEIIVPYKILMSEIADIGWSNIESVSKFIVESI